MTHAIPRPTDAVVTGYALGGCMAMYPSMLPRSVLIQLAVTLAFGLIGAGTGALIARWSGRGQGRGIGSLRLAAYVLSPALVIWLLWQNHLRDAAQVDPIGPLGFVALAASTAAAPTIGSVLVAARRRVLAISTAVIAVVGVGWPASTAFGAIGDESPSYAQRFGSVKSASPGVRVYASLSDGADPSERAAVAVGRLIADGGLTKRVLAVAVPTGSGWVDPHFVRGLEERTRGDVAIVAVQYTQQPSWQSFLLHRDAAAATSVALIDELYRRAPMAQVRVYGQSLGAVGVVAAQDRARALGHPLAATMQSGTPASVAVVGPAQLNSSDPVGVWSLGLALAPPTRTATAPGANVPRPPWVPIISFLQTSIDLVSATATSPGVGHRYGGRQGSDLDLGARLPTPV